MLPVLLRFGPITIYSFGIFITLAVVAITFLVWRQARMRGLSEERVFDTLFLVIAAVLLIGRAIHVANNWIFFGEDFGRILLFLKYPGISFTGGLLGGIGVAIVVAKAFGLGVLETLDVLVFGLAMGMVVGLLGCFLDGCMTGQEWAPIYLAGASFVWVLVLGFIEKQLLGKAELAGFYRRYGIFFLTYLIFQSLSFLILSHLTGWGNTELFIGLLVIGIVVFVVRYFALIKMIQFPDNVLVQIKKFLESRRKDLEKQLTGLKREDPFEDKDRLMDAASEDTVAQSKAGHERTTALVNQINVALIQTRKALAKMKIGKYGICENCGNMIDTDRLTVMPAATFCMTCEKKREKK